MQRKLQISLVVLCVIAGLVLAYAFLNMPFYGNVLPPYDSSRNPVNVDFKFGVGARNELDTFQGTFTKDLFIDGTVTARMILSETELKQIQQKLKENDFFNTPETFPLKEPITVPDMSYYLKVQDGTTVKEVSWNEMNSVMDSSTSTRLSTIAGFLVDLIVQKPEYQKLPPANGYYL